MKRFVLVNRVTGGSSEPLIIGVRFVRTVKRQADGRAMVELEGGGPAIGLTARFEDIANLIVGQPGVKA